MLTENHQRCARCRMRQDLCLCRDLPCLDLKTRVIVMMHQAEKDKTTNTANLAKLCLKNSAVLIHGEKNEPLCLQDSLFADTAYQPILLFPEEGASELNHDTLRKLGKGPYTLVVPDGTWRQATKISRRIPELLKLPRVKLALGPPTEYQLRRRVRPEGVCTIEAIARALSVLESPQVEVELMRVFRVMVERTLWSRRSSGPLALKP